MILAQASSVAGKVGETAVRAVGQPRPDFGPLNWLVLLAYLAGMIGIGVYFSRREKSTEQFFLGGRKIPWWAAGLSIFGTQLSAITFMAIPATAYNQDWRRIIGNFMIMPVIVLVIFVFLPFFRRLPISTAYEYLESRFNYTVRITASLLFMLLQLGRMGIVLFLPATALSAVTGMDVYLCIGLMGVLATVYTYLGGIDAVIWTDVVQVIVLLGGAILCIGMAAAEVGGLGAMLETAQSNGKLTMVLTDFDFTDFTIWVVTFCAFFSHLVPYSTDQTVVQRYLTTRDQKRAAGSLWLNFAMTAPTAFLFFGLGTALWAFYAQDWTQLRPTDHEQVVPWFVAMQLPAGIAGLVIAAIFAASMSSLDSSMNSVATAYVNDVHRRFRPETNDANELRLARRITILLGGLGTGVAMIMASIEIKFIFDLFISILGLFGGGLAAVFLLATLTRRASSAGVLTGLLVSSLANVGLFVVGELDEAYKVQSYVYAAVGCLISLAVGYLASLAMPERSGQSPGFNIHQRE